VFVGQATGTVIGLVVAWPPIRSRYRIAVDRVVLRQMLAFSLPLVPASIGVIVSTYADRLIVSRLLGLDDVATLGVAARIGGTVGIVMGGLQLGLVPLIYASHRDPDVPRDLAALFRVVVALTTVIVLGLGLLAPEIISILATSAYEASAPLVAPLAVSTVLPALVVFAPGLTIAGRTGAFAAIALGAAACDVILNLTLVPSFGLAGAVMGTVIGMTVLFGASMVASQRIYPVPYRWRLMAAAVGVAAGLLVVSALIPAELPSLAIRIGLLTVGVAAILALGVVRPRELLTILRTGRPEVSG
jgi:O-antigen/teichoic acid export membrane protein